MSLSMPAHRLRPEMSQKRNIVFMGPMHPYRGGIAQFLETMYRGMAHRGHTVSAVNFSRQYPALLFPGKTQLDVGEVASPVPSERLIDSINPVSWSRTARWILDQQPDALVFKYWIPFLAPAFGRIARKVRKQGVKVIANVDNAIPHERRPGDIVLGRYCLNAADACIAMSASVVSDLETMGVETETKLVNHPVYDHFGPTLDVVDARRRLGIELGVPVLLFFGFVRQYKGLQTLLEGLPRILSELPDAKLIVAGEFYDDERPYRDFIERHNLGRAVKIHADYITNSDVAMYFSAADVVVQPYLSATQSGVAQIAYHFDKPAIITDVGGLAETVPHEKAGLVVPPDNPDALAHAVIRFFKEDMAEQLSRGVQLEKPKYSWDRLYETIEALM